MLIGSATIVIYAFEIPVDIGMMVRVFANGQGDSKNGTWCLLA